VLILITNTVNDIHNYKVYTNKIKHFQNDMKRMFLNIGFKLLKNFLKVQSTNCKYKVNLILNAITFVARRNYFLVNQ